MYVIRDAFVWSSTRLWKYNWKVLLAYYINRISTESLMSECPATAANASSISTDIDVFPLLNSVALVVQVQIQQCGAMSTIPTPFDRPARLHHWSSGTDDHRKWYDVALSSNRRGWWSEHLALAACIHRGMLLPKSGGTRRNRWFRSTITWFRSIIHNKD
jgi:hypothetical protein